MVQAGKDYSGSNGPTALLKQGPVTHDCVQAGFEYFH